MAPGGTLGASPLEHVLHSYDIRLLFPWRRTPPHLGGSHVYNPGWYTWLPDIWEHLILSYNVRSVLDLGCGAGFSTRWFQERVGTALGVEADPEALAHRQCDHIVTHDYARGAFVPVDIYDLAWCAEFVEHVEQQHMANWMATLQRCRYVCMTFAVPGQHGHHHVNEQPEEYWLDRFHQAGFDHLADESASLRATADDEAWGRTTLTFFRNRVVGHPDPSWLLRPMKQEATVLKAKHGAQALAMFAVPFFLIGAGLAVARYGAKG